MSNKLPAGNSTLLKTGLSLLAILWSIVVLSADPAKPSGGSTAPRGVYIPIVGAIGPATKDYVVQALAKARNIGASLFIIQMDTPGGLESSMRDINQAILSSSQEAESTSISPS